MLHRIIFLLAMVFSFHGFASAASVEVNWNDPDSYSDIRHASRDSKKSFRERVFSQLEGHITKLAKALPEDWKLTMDFTNVVLAGNVDPVRITDSVRVVQGHRYPARLAFDFTLKEASGNVLEQGSEHLTSSSGITRTTRTEAFGIEKKMLTDWFNKTLK